MIDSLPATAWSALVLTVGLLVGSFLNVCIWRIPRGESIVWPGSRCPRCGRPIRWYENVPILSWILLRGRCAGCRGAIPFRYLMVEALAGASTLALWLHYGPSASFALAAPFTLAMLVLFFTDFDHMILPDLVTLPGFATGLATAWLSPFLGEAPWPRTWASLSGAALGAGILWGLGAFYSRLRGVEAMGLGDVKMIAMVGAFAGPKGVLFTLFIASVAGALVGVSLIPLRGRSLRHTLPFGCFLAPSAVAALVWGGRVVEWYLGLLRPGP